jgi:hypothetical protein
MHIHRLAVVVLAVQLLTACRGSTDRMLVGKWENTFPDIRGVMFLRADHVVLGLPADDGSVTTRGTWRVDGNQLYQTVEASGTKPAIPEFAWTILKVDRNELRVRTIGSTELLFKRLE